MAEPWTDDFAALEARSRHGLRSLDATRASLSTRPQETKMRFFKSHPALSALLALAILGAASGAAYAVVREVWVDVDPTKSAPEIEQDVTTQLQQQGVNATVHADKTDGKLLVAIKSDDKVGSDVELKFRGVVAEGQRRAMRLEGDVDDATRETIDDLVTSPEMLAVLAADYQDPNDGTLAAGIRKVLADHGITNVDIKIDDDGIHVIVQAPPARP